MRPYRMQARIAQEYLNRVTRGGIPLQNRLYIFPDAHPDSSLNSTGSGDMFTICLPIIGVETMILCQAVAIDKSIRFLSTIFNVKYGFLLPCSQQLASSPILIGIADALE